MDEARTIGAVPSADGAADMSMSAKIHAQMELEQQAKLAEMRTARKAQDEIEAAQRRRKKKARKASYRSAARNRR